MNLENILVDSNILNGNPHLKGTRLTVFNVIMDCSYLGVAEFLETYEEYSISFRQLIVVLEYCKSRQCDIDGGHCGGCSLRNIQDGILSKEDFINRFKEVRFTESNDIIEGDGEGTFYLKGYPEDLDENWKGENGWLIANELLDKVK